MTLLAVATLGILMGFLAGFLGTGGGTLAIPALVLLFGYDQKLAQGTVLVMVIANVAKGFMKYRSLSGIDSNMAATLGVSASIATVVGAYFLTIVPSPLLRTLYGIFLLGLIVPLVMARLGLALSTPLQPGYAVVPGVLGGLTLGMFGVGGAMLTVPFLTSCFGMKQVKAQGAALAVAVPGCIICFFPYIQREQVDWRVAILLAVFSLPTVTLGVKAAHLVSEKILVLAFCSLTSVTGIALLLAD